VVAAGRQGAHTRVFCNSVTAGAINMLFESPPRLAPSVLLLTFDIFKTLLPLDHNANVQRGFLMYSEGFWKAFVGACIHSYTLNAFYKIHGRISLGWRSCTVLYINPQPSFQPRFKQEPSSYDIRFHTRVAETIFIVVLTII
jgi:hypothetical protein